MSYVTARAGREERPQRGSGARDGASSRAGQCADGENLSRHAFVRGSCAGIARDGARRYGGRGHTLGKAV